MPFGILGEQHSGGIQVGVLANAGKNIEHFTAGGGGVLHSVGCQQRKTKSLRQIDQLLVKLIFPANKVPLNFDVNIFTTKRVD